MGRFFLRESQTDGYFCCICMCHLASYEDCKSKTFHSRSGRAYLFEAVDNITLGKRENRTMTTGLHEVSDVHCTRCNQLCGWRYEVAHQETQKYKEGMYVLERDKLLSSDEQQMDFIATPPHRHFLRAVLPIMQIPLRPC